MVFVTGATGLLGSHLIPALLQQQQSVRALYRSQIPSFDIGDKRIEWIKGDILDVPLLEDALQGVEQVYHCAGLVSFHANRVDDLYKTNVEGTANVINACLATNVKKVLHVSSVAALGRTAGTTVDESSPWTEVGSSVYGKTKHLAEMEVWRGVGEGLDAVIINPTIILGAGDWNQGSSQIFKTVYNEFPWYSDGVTGFVDVLDVVNAALLLMNSPITAERFIINAGNVRYKEVFDMIADGFHKAKSHRKVTPFLAWLIWRAEKLRQWLTGSHPLLTKETAATAQAKVFFNNNKLLQLFPDFQYSPLPQSILRICADYQKKYGLS